MASPAVLTPTQQNALKALIRHSRYWCAGVLAGVALVYFGAYTHWQDGQTMPAVLLLVFGYLLSRSMRQIVFNRTWQAFRDQPEHAQLLQRVGAARLLSREATLKKMLLANVR